MEFNLEATSDEISAEILTAYLAGYGTAALYENTIETWTAKTGGPEAYAARLFENQWQRKAYAQGFGDRRGTTSPLAPLAGRGPG